MTHLTPGRRALAVTSLIALAVGASACGSSTTKSGTATGAAKPGCEAYASYGDLSGKKVSIYTGIVTPEDKPQIDSYKPFERCTGATISYEGDKSFEAQILVRAKADNAPDLAIVPQPGLLKQLVKTGKAVKAPDAVAANVDKFWSKDWKGYGTVDGAFYAAPLGARACLLLGCGATG